MFRRSQHPLSSRSAWNRSITGWNAGRRMVWSQGDRPWSRPIGKIHENLRLESRIAEPPAESTSKLPDDDPVERRRRTEAVLLFHRGPVNLRKLAQLAGLADATEARTLLRQLNEIYDQAAGALRVEEIAGGYQLLTRPGLAPWLRRFASAPQSVRLSVPAMETLAIVAYRQPVLRANIEAIRGVACGEIIRQLLQRDFVRICGRSEELGRPYLYGTTRHFLQTFGLKEIQSLPTMTGAGVEDDSEDTCANPIDQDQVEPSASPIDPTIQSDVSLPAVSSFDVVT